MYDVAIIGGGIVGTAIARELSKYKLRTVLLEKENDISLGATKANSGVVHAGYDPKYGSLKGKLNVLGNAMYESLCKELDVPFKKIGSLVLGFNEEEMKVIKDLYENGIKLGVPNLQILDKEAAMKVEPNISDKVIGALYAPTAGIVGPWEMAIALMENAMDNGVELKLNNGVTNIEKNREGYKIYTSEGKINTKYIINAAGIFADEIHNMVADPCFKIIPRKGEYHLLDKSEGNKANTVIFQCPTEKGKGVLVLPTVHGNLIIGPNSEIIEEKDDVTTTQKGLEYVRHLGENSVKEIDLSKVITSFSGIRAKTSRRDFIIEEVKGAEGFIDVAGIDSPGLTAAPAIAEYVVNLLEKRIGKLEKNEEFNPNRRKVVRFMELTDDEKKEIINQNPKYGRVICRCENITEGEIIDIIHRNAGATTVDGVKRRARPGSGRCQGGFCLPRVMEILARETNKDIKDIVKDKQGSYILKNQWENIDGMGD
ncbi:NAD(P)/FAD-dependent oxidoreductase [Tissierella sp. MSJ-40]|uniref:NAD(P)/FAD-dependent oxidoreductase n=1 Tax=Tissierella simiarum TaxID=2841534 RepID=A0ABS6E9Q3_9FIRM|nr:NAD(P)/FAD-dependent oxidoreductase [Tissierella simiarum]